MPQDQTEPRVEVSAKETQVSCGGAGTLNHPRVYLKFDHSNTLTCPYCSREFVRKTSS